MTTELRDCYISKVPALRFAIGRATRRDEIKFPSVEALKEQIGRDVRKAQTYLRRLGRVGIRS